MQLQLLGRLWINASIRMGDHINVFSDWRAMLLCESWTDILMRSFTKPAENIPGIRKAGDALCRSCHIGVCDRAA
jgi:hypothetical protein